MTKIKIVIHDNAAFAKWLILKPRLVDDHHERILQALIDVQRSPTRRNWLCRANIASTVITFFGEGSESACHAARAAIGLVDHDLPMLTLADVLKRLSVSRSALYMWIDLRGFPTPFNCPLKPALWLSVDVDRWMTVNQNAGWRKVRRKVAAESAHQHMVDHVTQPEACAPQ